MTYLHFRIIKHNVIEIHSVTKELWYLEEVLPISLFCRFHHARVFKSCSIKDHVCKVVEIHCFDTEKRPILLKMVNGKIMVPWKLYNLTLAKRIICW